MMRYIKHALLFAALLLTSCARLAYVDQQNGYDQLKRPHIRVLIYDGSASIRLDADEGYVLRAWLDNGDKPTYYSASELEVTAKSGKLILNDTRGNLLERDLLKATLFPSKRGQRMWVDGKRFRGNFEVFPEGGNRFYVVNVINVEDYLRGVLPPEIGKRNKQEYEALKVQAVAARTYALATKAKYPDKEYDLINDIRDQVYSGIMGETKPTDRAIAETRGEVMMYGGEIIEAYYHSTCAGRTEDISEVWDREPLPYLRSVTDLDYCKWSKFYDWNEIFTATELLDHIRGYLESKGEDASVVGRELRDLKITSHTTAGRVKAVQLTTEQGTFNLHKDQIRWAFGRSRETGILRSTNFRLNLEYGTDGLVSKVHVTGYGYGHGLGLCQCGAIGMARAGFGYEHILTHYYSGARLEKLY
ncbi:MAG: SpoIID/LytB domain-containing protein [bacterium]